MMVYDSTYDSPHHLIALVFIFLGRSASCSCSCSASAKASAQIFDQEDVTSSKVKVQITTIWHCTIIYTLEHER